jgi:hypothetical protein
MALTALSAKMVVVEDHQQREPSMSEITTIGLDFAKNFQCSRECLSVLRMAGQGDISGQIFVRQSTFQRGPVVALRARRHFAGDWSQIVHEVRGKIRKAVAGRMYASTVKGPRSDPGPYFLGARCGASPQRIRYASNA